MGTRWSLIWSLLVLLVHTASSFAGPVSHCCRRPPPNRTTRRAMMAGVGATSVLAGSLAGAIGIGLAFPLDTLKTKAQVLGQELRLSLRNAAAAEETLLATHSALLVSSLETGSGLPVMTTSAPVETNLLLPKSTRKIMGMNMWRTAQIVLEREGVQGFFSGIKGVVAGEAIIKAVAFSANAVAYSYLDELLPAEQHTMALLAAACLSGLATSFIVAPVERIKVMMQASPELYQTELQCLEAILAKEGWAGLFQRGLGTTLLREIPGYGIYFGLYSLLKQSFDLGPLSTLIFGATAGSASWIPVYPIDVVKTLVQNTAGGEETASSAWEVAATMYKQGGVGAFFEGMTPKLLRAAVHHAATFTIYDSIMHSVIGKT